MIFRETPMGQALSAVDLREKEGVLVKIDSNGRLTPITAASDNYVGVVHIGADVGLPTTFLRFSYPGEVGVKLSSTAGSVAEGTPLVATATGTFAAKSGAGRIAAYACAAGENDELLSATLCAPLTVSA